MTAVLLLIAFLFIVFSGQPEVMSRGELIQAAGSAGKQPSVQRQHACFKYQGGYSYRQTHLNMDKLFSYCLFQMVVVGAGPIGLRTAIEAQLLGARVVVMEKRSSFTR